MFLLSLTIFLTSLLTTIVEGRADVYNKCSIKIGNFDHDTMNARSISRQM